MIDTKPVTWWAVVSLVSSAVGCLAGAAIALLVTPVSGVEARKRIGEQVVKAQQSRVPEELPTNGSTRSSSYTPASPYVAS